VEDLISLAHSCKLDRLETSLEERYKSVVSFECTKPGVSVSVFSLEPSMNEVTLQLDLGLLANEALPVDFGCQTGVELPFPPECSDVFADVIFSVEGHLFHCHKVFFANRSEYFKVLLADHFDESQQSTASSFSSFSSSDCRGLSVITLHDISVSTFVQIMYYIYQDSCELTDQNVYEILFKADFFLLPGLKRQCSSVIAHYIDTQTVMSTLRLSRLFSLSRLEDQCTEYIANNLEQMVSDEDLHSFIREDAQSVQQRQATDSIPCVDDIRFHITNSVQTFGDMYEAEQRLAIMDALLDDLQLDA